MARMQGLTLSRNNRGLLLLALVAGAAAAILVFVGLSSSGDGGSGSSAPAATTQKVVVAGQDIDAGTTVTAEMLKVVEIPQDLVLSNPYYDTAPVVGQVTNVDVSAGEQITQTKLGSFARGEIDALSDVVPHDFRGVSKVSQELTAVGGKIIPGDHVDIIASYKIRDIPGLPENAYILRTEYILQNAEVLSVAQESLLPKAQPGAGGEQATTDGSSYSSGDLPEDVEEQPKAGTLTVALDPAQTLKLISFQDSPATVRVWAVLRRFGQTNIIEVEPFDQLVIDD